MIKYGLSLLAVTILGVAIYLLANFLPQLQDNYLFVAYSAFVVLTLPWLVSRVLLRRPVFSSVTVVIYLIYPAAYYLCFLLSSWAGLDRAFLLHLSSVLAVVLWHLLVAVGAATLPTKELKQLLRNIGLLIPVWVIYSIVLILTREVGSVLALDYLQHQTVVNGLLEGARACFLPIDCSNLFLQQGYSVFYHSVLGFAGSFLGNNLDKLFFVLDFALPIAGSFLIYSLINKVTAKPHWVLLGTLITLFVFNNGAYEFVFFIPQNLAFLLFLIVLASGRLTLVKLALSVPVILLSHFVMGAFLAGIVLVKWLLIDLYLGKARSHQTQVLLVLLLIPLQFVISLNLLGFSFERLFQARELEVIGSPTNFAFPDNVYFVVGILGPAVVLLVAATIGFLLKKDRPKVAWIGFLGITINLATFFLAITYANKFLIGLGLFSAILVVTLLSTLQLRRVLSVFVIIAVAVVYAANFYSNYKYYLPFYRQESGHYSALVAEDRSLIKFLGEERLSCTVLSDPYTQLMVATYTGMDTAKAHYMKLPSRKLLDEFVATPNEKAYEALLEISELEGETDICFVYTGRLQRSLSNNDKFWLQNIYTYTLDNNLRVNNLPLENFLQGKSARGLFRDDHFLLFRLP